MSNKKKDDSRKPIKQSRTPNKPPEQPILTGEPAELASVDALYKIAQKIQLQLMQKGDEKAGLNDYLKILQVLKEAEAIMVGEMKVQWIDPLWAPAEE